MNSHLIRSLVPLYPHRDSIWQNLDTTCSLPVRQHRGTSKKLICGLGFTVKYRKSSTTSRSSRMPDWAEPIANSSTVISGKRIRRSARDRTFLWEKTTKVTNVRLSSSVYIYSEDQELLFYPYLSIPWTQNYFFFKYLMDPGFWDPKFNLDLPISMWAQLCPELKFKLEAFFRIKI